MKIAQIAPIALRIPPKKYGGTERIVHCLTEDLVKLGHEVTLFASADSQTSAKLVSVTPKALKDSTGKDPYIGNALTSLHFGLAYKMQSQFDIIHDHTGSLSFPAAQLATTPVVTTMHLPFLEEVQSLYATLTNPYIVTISKKQAEMGPKNMNHAGTIYHGLKMEQYPFSKKNGGYLLFVGRITREKGVHYAIKVAKKLNLPLIIAAKLEKRFDEDVTYFEKQVKPFLSAKIKWIGEVNEKERNRLMSKAICFLHPVTWPEPFGLVLIEALACGTPVVALNQGSIPEIIKHGKTGFVGNTVADLVEGVKNIASIDRRFCREYALTNFDSMRMTQDYIEVYQRIIKQEQQKKQAVKPTPFSPLYLSASKTVPMQLVKPNFQRKDI